MQHRYARGLAHGACHRRRHARVLQHAVLPLHQHHFLDLQAAAAAATSGATQVRKAGHLHLINTYADQQPSRCAMAVCMRQPTATCS